MKAILLGLALGMFLGLGMAIASWVIGQRQPELDALLDGGSAVVTAIIMHGVCVVVIVAAMAAIAAMVRAVTA